jgi:hypothetical protein
MGGLWSAAPGPQAEGFLSVRRPSDGEFHDLTTYHIALVHESDAELDNGAFYKTCVCASTPCVLFSGGTLRAKSETPRLLYLSDSDVLAHSEAGITFWQRTGRLDLTAWTKGMSDACRAEIHRLCEPLRRLLRSASDVLPPAEYQAAKAVPEKLTEWCASTDCQRSLQGLSTLLDALPANDAPASAGWLRQNREHLASLLSALVVGA